MNKHFFEVAYKEAIKAYKNNEIPVGTVIVKNGKVVSKAHNNRQVKKNILGHAEINAILKAEKYNNDWRLDGFDLYVTLFPCEMCQIIIKEARISNVYYLVDNKNVKKIIKNCTKIDNYNDIVKNYKNIIDDFFKKLRK